MLNPTTAAMEKTPLDTPFSNPEIVDCGSLKCWNQISARELPAGHLSEHQEKNFDSPPYPYNTEINKKVALWIGDVTQLNADAIVNTTNESVSDKGSLSQRVLFKGGPQMRQQIKTFIRSVRTGDAKITKGYDLPARYVIHTVGPKYNLKYHTAAESALYASYSKVLQLMRENNIKTLGLSPINSVRRGYPPYDGAHMALRVVRRFVEQFASEVDLIVFVVEDVDIGIYELLMPLYFPRSSQEECYSLYLLPKEKCGPNGEPLRPERQIRIADKPVTAHKSADIEESLDLCSGMEASVVVGKSSFAKMHGDVDQRWKSDKVNKANDAISDEIQRKNHYERLMRKAKLEDLSDIASLRCFYVTGEDRHGRPIVVLIGKRFEAKKIDLERALLYLVSTLDRIVQKEYIVVYFHTLTTSDNHPSMNYIRYVFDTLEYRYKKNLRALYVVHPTFWARVLTWWFTTFSASSLKNKVFCLGGVEYLSSLLPLEQLQVPSFIMDYDFKVNGVRYSAEEAVPAESL